MRRLSHCFPLRVEGKKQTLCFVFWLFVLTLISRTVRETEKTEDIFLYFIPLSVKRRNQFEKYCCEPFKYNFFQKGRFRGCLFLPFGDASLRHSFRGTDSKKKYLFKAQNLFPSTVQLILESLLLHFFKWRNIVAACWKCTLESA